ncbi:unnamed protein product [Rhizoctonia solani]|uniref:HTH CENPB-type domain-containing protein n=1 Tax=Rhizoctonia solani TaxID=456999 RepID=A0A8H3CZJ8_9AGAM|nr:unnamed protein product [Rhizoctonia solani]
MVAQPPHRRQRGPRPARQLSSALHPALMKRKHLTYHDRLEIINFHHLNPHYTQSDLAQYFRSRFPNITQATISRCLSKEQEIRSYITQFPQRLSYTRPLSVLLPAVEAAITQWVTEMLDHGGVQLSGPLICEKARQFCQLLGIADGQLEFSQGWLSSFKERMGLHRVWFHGEAASAPVDRIAPEIERLQPIFASFSPQDAFNFDETAVLSRAQPESGLSNRPMSGAKKDKTRLTFGFCVNADGSEKRPPFILGFSKQPRSFKGRTAAQHGLDYDNNSSAWMTDQMWNKWLVRFNADMRGQGRHVLLLVDNASGHKKFNPNLYPNVRVEFLAPGLTSFLQPLDAGIIRCFKAHFRRAQVRRALARLEAGEAKIYHIEPLEAMQMGKAAWDAILPSTIVNCWRHTGICPPNYFPLEKPSSPDLEDALVVSDLQDGLDRLSSQQPNPDITSRPTANEFIDLDRHLEAGAMPSEESIADDIRQIYAHAL